jgi:hypothetical protein
MKPIGFALLISMTSSVCAARAVRGGDVLGIEPALRARDLYGEAAPAPGLTLAGGGLEALAAWGPAPAAGLATASGSASLGQAVQVGAYLVERAGAFWFVDDLDRLNVGFNGEIGFGYRVSSFLALEIHSGYLWGEDADGPVDFELWSVPVVASVKLVIPIASLDFYVGAGGGLYYIDTERSDGVDEEEFAFGANVFAGATIALGIVALGIEAKYVHTGEFDIATVPEGGTAELQGFALMGTLTFEF